MEPAETNSLRPNVYATLAYFDLFDYPLTIVELQRFLLWTNADYDELWTFLNNDPKIQRHGDYYFFKGRRAIVDVRREREKVAAEFWAKVRRFLPYIQMVPFVKMAAVCNTLALNNPTRDSDIDLFIVCEKGRLFLARTITTILFALFGMRRHGKKIAGRFCLSFYVTEDALNLEQIKLGAEDIYLPFWLLTLKPLYGEEVYERLLMENRWMQKFFPRPVEVEETWKANRFLRGFGRVQECIYRKNLGDRLEEWTMRKQLERYHRSLKNLGPESSVIVNEKMLKFHNIDRRREFAERFRKRYEDVMMDVTVPVS